MDTKAILIAAGEAWSTALFRGDVARVASSISNRAHYGVAAAGAASPEAIAPIGPGALDA